MGALLKSLRILPAGDSSDDRPHRRMSILSHTEDIARTECTSFNHGPPTCWVEATAIRLEAITSNKATVFFATGVLRLCRASGLRGLVRGRPRELPQRCRRPLGLGAQMEKTE